MPPNRMGLAGLGGGISHLHLLLRKKRSEFGQEGDELDKGNIAKR